MFGEPKARTSPRNPDLLPSARCPRPSTARCLGSEDVLLRHCFLHDDRGEAPSGGTREFGGRDTDPDLHVRREGIPKGTPRLRDVVVQGEDWNPIELDLLATQHFCQKTSQGWHKCCSSWKIPR